MKKCLIRPNFCLSYTKSKYKKMEEGASFLLEGELITKEDHEASSQFMAEALGNPEIAQHFRHIDSCSAVLKEPFSSAHVETHWAFYFPDPDYPGFSEKDDENKC